MQIYFCDFLKQIRLNENAFSLGPHFYLFFCERTVRFICIIYVYTLVQMK